MAPTPTPEKDKSPFTWCADCLYWVQRIDPKGPSESGECRAKPPTVSVISSDRSARFPITVSTDFCAEGKHK